ncbi:MAG: hypothetical protein ACI30W_01330 [Muribaculaceae bacterium]
MKNDEQEKTLKADSDGLQTYEYIANNIDDIDGDLPWLVENMKRVDLNGQFLASAARYLHAIDGVRYSAAIKDLVAATIDRDREHRYLPDVMSSIYGEDYQSRAAELIATDDNFRRIYKRLYPKAESL